MFVNFTWENRQKISYNCLLIEIIKDSGQYRDRHEVVGNFKENKINICKRGYRKRGCRKKQLFISHDTRCVNWNIWANKKWILWKYTRIRVWGNSRRNLFFLFFRRQERSSQFILQILAKSNLELEYKCFIIWAPRIANFGNLWGQDEDN